MEPESIVYGVRARVYGVRARVYGVGARVYGTLKILVSAPVPLELIGIELGLTVWGLGLGGSWTKGLGLGLDNKKM